MGCTCDLLRKALLGRLLRYHSQHTNEWSGIGESNGMEKCSNNISRTVLINFKIKVNVEVFCLYNSVVYNRFPSAFTFSVAEDTEFLDHRIID